MFASLAIAMYAAATFEFVKENLGNVRMCVVTTGDVLPIFELLNST